MCSCNICLCVFLTLSLSDIVDIVSVTPSQPPSEAVKDGLDSDPMGKSLCGPEFFSEICISLNITPDFHRS